MFGYVKPNPKDATAGERRAYKMYYCGLCMALRRRHGAAATKALSYDMTFLLMLLSDLYDSPLEEKRESCQVHPIGRKYYDTKECGYCADMQVILSWWSAKDREHDDGDRKAAAWAREMEFAFNSCENLWPRQAKAVRIGIGCVAAAEDARSADPMDGADAFGGLLSEVFAMKDDIWAPTLRSLGRPLGRFTYLMDAWMDLPGDKEKGRYNPWTRRDPADPEFRKEVEEMLTEELALAADALERLPLDANLSILRNTLYSGVWAEFRARKSNT